MPQTARNDEPENARIVLGLLESVERDGGQSHEHGTHAPHGPGWSGMSSHSTFLHAFTLDRPDAGERLQQEVALEVVGGAGHRAQ